MMKLMLFTIFLIPLLFNWWMLFCCLLMLSFYMLFFMVSNYYMYISYGFGMDLVSYCMLFLSIWIISLMIMASNKIKILNNYEIEFLFIILILLLSLLLTFTTFNLFLFYFFFESSMIPILFLVFGWGYQPERFLAGVYLLFYTLFASFPLLLSIFYIFNFCNTLFYFLIISDFNYYLYFSLVMAFLVKMPMIFVHFWLPKAHVEAPVSGSMILAGVLLKLGGYGLYRVLYFMNNYDLNYLWIVLSLFGTFLVSMMCLMQIDIKLMIAYSSVAHMGLVISGIMTCFYFGFLGSLILMIGHGLCSSGLFVLANIVYERSHSRSFFINKGFIIFMPSMSLFWFLFCINNMSSPFSLNLFGEVMLFNSIMSWNSFTIIFLGLSSFLSCCYSIYLYSIIQHGSLFSGMFWESGGFLREYYLLFLHLFPLNLLFLKIDIFTFWV
uniref:NADH dehydrogenase subunit 4 n=1 Tax=Hygia lativentris TaxID=763191 RepID=UPI002E7A32FD|nr:NADH dehydrogenase subunit 4 [Hygia lativentris]WPV77645.1 NADH dehydrogenase subunit 4 [Hygia lativentris]